MQPDMIPAHSSKCVSFGHDPAADELYVKYGFEDGTTYVYSHVTTAMFADIKAAPSPAGYIAGTIKPNHKARKL